MTTTMLRPAKSCEALRDWKLRRELRHEELAALKADIDQALNEVAAGRLSEFNTDRIVERAG
ncbi:hypothetical protein [Nitrosospira multiformis]|uniref:hypothetical protein n=1 Tax=Nitrosospira multiformis TaxID=1231 RepID=UPI00089459E3|nr:hypothetical protein [Nitrosospira multiformis]SEA63125.1 antitoxin ParD1/3/4 [Nitrosospira multiformis]